MVWEMLTLYWLTIAMYCMMAKPEQFILPGPQRIWYFIACFEIGSLTPNWLGV